MSLICCKQINDLSLIKRKLKKIEIHKYSSIEDRLTDFFDKRELKILNVLGENWNNFDSIEINGIKYKLKKINIDFLINEKYKNYTFQNTNKVIYKSLLENNIKEKNKKINLINSLTKNDKNNDKNNNDINKNNINNNDKNNNVQFWKNLNYIEKINEKNIFERRKNLYLKRIIKLNISRSLGDLQAKELGIISEPEIVESNLKVDRGKVCVIGTLSLWKYLTEIEVGDVVRKHSRDNNSFAACRELEELAREKWKKNMKKVDDISVVIIFLEWKR
jgi:hypothetical protein